MSGDETPEWVKQAVASKPRETVSEEDRMHLAAVGLNPGYDGPHPEDCRCSKHPTGAGNERRHGPPKPKPEPE